MKIGIYEVKLREYYDPWLPKWTWIEAYKNDREVKYIQTIVKLSKTIFKAKGE